MKNEIQQSNFHYAVKSAISFIAEMLNRPFKEIAKEAMKPGAVQNSVTILTIHFGNK